MGKGLIKQEKGKHKPVYGRFSRASRREQWVVETEKTRGTKLL